MKRPNELTHKLIFPLRPYIVRSSSVQEMQQAYVLCVVLDMAFEAFTVMH
jgi:hypothetical protein